MFYLHVASSKGSMGGAPYIGPRLGDGLIFKAPLSQLDMKERLGKISTQSSNLSSSGRRRPAFINIGLILHGTIAITKMPGLHFE